LLGTLVSPLPIVLEPELPEPDESPLLVELSDDPEEPETPDELELPDELEPVDELEPLDTDEPDPDVPEVPVPDAVSPLAWATCSIRMPNAAAQAATAEETAIAIRRPTGRPDRGFFVMYRGSPGALAGRFASSERFLWLATR
jgi:hypothetical protein